MFSKVEEIKKNLEEYISIVRKNFTSVNSENYNNYAVDITNKYQDIIDYLDKIRLTSEYFFADNQVNPDIKSKIITLNGRDIVLPLNLYESITMFFNKLFDNILSLSPNNLLLLDNHRALNLQKINDHMESLNNIEKSLFEFFHRIVDYKGEKDLPFKSLDRQLNHYYKKFEILSKNLGDLENGYLRSSSGISNVYEQINQLNQKISDLNSNVLSAKSKYESDLSTIIYNVKDKFVNDAVEVVERLSSEIDEVNLIMNNEIDNIKKTTKNFNEFISDETSIKLTNNFKEKSESEKKWYYGFNIVSGIAIIFAICMSYFSLSDFADNHAKNFTQLDLYYLGIRLLFSFLIFSTVAFTNKLANKHYFHWKKNESTYLKLTALKSFIADMSPEKQQEIHEKLIDVYFGKEDLDPTIYKKMDNSNNDLIKFFTDKGIGLVNSKKID